MMVVQEGLSIQEKLAILSDAAKYDVACTSSGSQRSGAKGHMGSACAAGICHTFAADGRCISLLKILFTNECVYDCKYCVNRASNDVVRTSFTPEEVCQLTIQFYRRNYIEGLFLSSGVIRNPTYTMEQLYRTLYLLRYRYHFLGYIHVKGIPGADPVLIEKIGYLADRMSVNLELPTAEGLRRLAPNKTRETILSPIRAIRAGMETNPRGAAPGAYWTSRFHAFGDPEALQKKQGFSDCLMGNGQTTTGLQVHSDKSAAIPEKTGRGEVLQAGSSPAFGVGTLHREDRSWLPHGRLSDFVPAGQSTQMIIGASGESDYQILTVTEALYRRFDMKRVFYSGFLNTTNDPLLPVTPGGPPLLREHRLYQADWLLRYYGFRTDELVDEQHPNFNLLLDPKCSWALRHLECFPIEVMTASYEELLRVPGIGVKSAGRIVRARKSTALDMASLKRIGVVLKRAHFFITCCGKTWTGSSRFADLEEKRLESMLISQEYEKNWQLTHPDDWQQLSLFPGASTQADMIACPFGD